MKLIYMGLFLGLLCGGQTLQAVQCPATYAAFQQKFCFKDGRYWAFFQGAWWNWVDNYGDKKVLRRTGTGPGSDPRNDRPVALSELANVDPTPGLTAALVPPARPPYQTRTSPPIYAQQDGWQVVRYYTGLWDDVSKNWVPGGGQYSDWQKVKPIDPPKPLPSSGTDIYPHSSIDSPPNFDGEPIYGVEPGGEYGNDSINAGPHGEIDEPGPGEDFGSGDDIE